MDLLGTIHPSPVVISRRNCRITPLSGPLCCPRPSCAGGPPRTGAKSALGSYLMPMQMMWSVWDNPRRALTPFRVYLVQWNTPGCPPLLQRTKKVTLALYCLGGQVLLSLLLKGHCEGGQCVQCLEDDQCSDPLNPDAKFFCRDGLCKRDCSARGS